MCLWTEIPQPSFAHDMLMRILIHTYVRTFLHTHTHIYIHAYIHTHTYVCSETPRPSHLKSRTRRSGGGGVICSCAYTYKQSYLQYLFHSVVSTNTHVTSDPIAYHCHTRYAYIHTYIHTCSGNNVFMHGSGTNGALAALLGARMHGGTLCECWKVCVCVCVCVCLHLCVCVRA